MRKQSALIAFVGIMFSVLARAASPASQSCAEPIGEADLRAELAKTAYFASGIPPPGKVMRIEKGLCGYVVYVGTHSPDEIGGTEFQVDGKGHIISVNTTY